MPNGEKIFAQHEECGLKPAMTSNVLSFFFRWFFTETGCSHALESGRINSPLLLLSREQKKPRLICWTKRAECTFGHYKLIISSSFYSLTSVQSSRLHVSCGSELLSVLNAIVACGWWWTANFGDHPPQSRVHANKLQVIFTQ